LILWLTIPLSSTFNIVKDGKLKSIMLISSQRLPDAPGVPTANELGIDVDNLQKLASIFDQ